MRVDATALRLGAVIVTDWMRQLAEGYEQARRDREGERLLVVFDIDGTILDMRHAIRHVLVDYDRAHGSHHFHDLRVEDIDVHENQVGELLIRRGLPDGLRARVLRWHEQRFWDPAKVAAAHRPFRGVLEVIRWFQLQPDTEVALNTGRSEALRQPTLRCLNELGREHRVVFESELLAMRHDTDERVTDAKIRAVDELRARGFRVVAVVDNEPENLSAIADAVPGVLCLHADTIYESKRPVGSAAVSGTRYELSSLIGRDAVPDRIQLVWHGVNDEGNLAEFLASPIRWAECDVRAHPVDGLVGHHDPFDEYSWMTAGALPLAELLDAVAERDRAVKLDFKESGTVLDRTLDMVESRGLDDDRLWFNARVETLGEAGFRRLAIAHPGSIRQCPVDFLAPLVLGSPATASGVLDELAGWGINRFSVSWTHVLRVPLVEFLEDEGWEVNVYAVPDLEAFLRAVVLLPTSITADFDFPEWSYFGRGSGERSAPESVATHVA